MIRIGRDYGQAHEADHVPMGVLNGYLTRARNRGIPQTDIDHAPREFRRFVNQGSQDVQLINGLYRRIGTGLRVPFVDYLYAVNTHIPGQDRDDWSGKHKRGIGPLQYRSLFRETAGAQPRDPGGIQSRALIGDSVFNPMTSLGGLLYAGKCASGRGRPAR